MVRWIKSLFHQNLTGLRPRTRLNLELLEDREVPSAVMADYAVTQNWGSGFQATVSLQNPQAAAVQDWKLEFDYAASISSIWDGKVVSRTGNRYVVSGNGWNNTINGNSNVSFGFVAAGSVAAPTNFVLNGERLDSGTPPPVVTLPTISIADATVSEPASGSANASFTVTLSAAATSSVTVKYATGNGTAMAGSDYTAGSGTITFAAGQTSKTITVPVLADSLTESNETFTVTLSNPTGATLARGQAVGTVRDTPPAPPPPPTPQAGVADFKVTSDWGSGFNADITVKNAGTAALNNWTLSFDFAGQISSIWNAKIVSQVGTKYVVRGETWNSSLSAGASTTFGFSGSPGNVAVSPTGYALGGTPVGGTTTPPPAGYVAVNDTGWTTKDSPVVLNVLANDTGNGVTVTAITQPGRGKVVRNPDGTVTYTPATGYTGADSFTYSTRDASGATATASVALTVANPAVSAWPAHVFAPYIDMTLYPTPDLAGIALNEGVRFFSLAFVTADPANKPAWGGYAEYGINGGAFDTSMRTAINGVRALGGDVSVSFGGANGQEMAQVITDVTQLKNAYKSVVDAYGLTHVDFDIEGAAAAEKTSIDRRSQALAMLQNEYAAAGKPLTISFTLPVLPTGLTPDGMYVLQSAVRYGVQINIVNIMAMDYGDSAAPNPRGQMGTYAIQAATSLQAQLKTLYPSKTESQLWAMVGVTPMIGMNDVTTEVFDQAAARQLLVFAQQKGIGMLSMWSLARDRQDPRGALNYASYDSSSIVQSPFEFSDIFGAFNG